MKVSELTAENVGQLVIIHGAVMVRGRLSRVGRWDGDEPLVYIRVGDWSGWPPADTKCQVLA